MRAVCILALVVPAACLTSVKSLKSVETKSDHQDINNARPRYAKFSSTGVTDVEVVWQRPSQPAIGTFLYLHGCGNKALDMWTTTGHDGFEFTACNNTKKGYCAGLPQEGLMKDIARSRGYIVIAVQGGATSNRGCFHPEDVPRIKAAINHVYTVEKLGELPMIMTGMSAGGRTLGELASSTGGAGVPMKCAAPMVAELNTKAAWALPNNLPVLMIHMPKDGLTEKLIGKSITALKSKKLPFESKEIAAEPINERFLMAGGHGLNATTAKKVMDAFNKAQLLNEVGNLKLDPYNPKPKTRWMKAIENSDSPDLRSEIGGFGQQATVTKLMERSWAAHALTGDRTNEIIDFCEHPPAAPEGGAKAHKKK